MPVYYCGRPIPENVCVTYEDNEAVLFQDLGNERPEAIRCLMWRLKPQVAALGYRFGFSEEEIDDIVTDAVVETMFNIQRGQEGNGQS